MKCSSCGATEFERQATMSSMEMHLCKACGAEVAVHCNYVPDLSGVKLHELFLGTASVGSGPDTLKLLLKLKKELMFAERFEPAQLEAQYRAGKPVWELGAFLDFELEQAKQVCARLGLQASFNRGE